jgi:hypothetical protein
MTVFLLILSLFVCTPDSVYAQDMKPLYQLPEAGTEPENASGESRLFIAGSDKGLYRISGNNTAVPLWTEGKVEQILRTEVKSTAGRTKECWYFRTSSGILYSEDLEHFELRNDGLSFLTIKQYDGKTASLKNQVAMLRDLCADPLNPLCLVTATENSVYITRNGGKRWLPLGSTSKATPGMKAAAVATMPDGQLAVFESHPIFGLSYILPDTKNARWTDVSGGIKIMNSLTSTDEIADIYPMLRTRADGTKYVEIYFSQTYLPYVYRFDWENKTGVCIYNGKEPSETIDGLTSIDNALLFTRNESLGSIDVNTLKSPGLPVNFKQWKQSLSCVPGVVNTSWIPQQRSGFSKGLLLNELWLLYPGTVNTTYAGKAMGKKCIYVSAYQCREQAGIDKFRKVINDNNLNALVIDMKDDYGFLRYDTRDPLVMRKGRVTQYAVDLDHFVSEFKKDNVYLIARIVVFKDKNLTKYDNGRYSVWDNTTNAPWVGIKSYDDVTDEKTGEVTGHTIKYYDENWVDPYSPEVWEYNVAIAKELVSRGFDEIQFDYIRFPTDGFNLRNAAYRWHSSGMNKESALISFLSYARENLNVPIGIDIYGANGWYRSGTRTGQDAEMLAEYVDVISPMFYPSHFEQGFMNCAPYADRPYRIYFYGTYRTTVMTRNRAIARPWVQAFKLNVSYDRQYYGPDYIQKEIFGVRDSVNRGYLYWNNAGDYDYLLPDITAESKYTGTTPESDQKFRKPSIGTAVKPPYVDETISVLDSILNQESTVGTERTAYTPFLMVPLMHIR